MIDKSGTSRIVVKFDLVADSNADFTKAVDEETPQLAGVKGADAAQTVNTIVEKVALQASEQSHHTLSSDEVMRRGKIPRRETNDDRQDGNRAEVREHSSDVIHFGLEGPESYPLAQVARLEMQLSRTPAIISSTAIT